MGHHLTITEAQDGGFLGPDPDTGATQKTPLWAAWTARMGFSRRRPGPARPGPGPRGAGRRGGPGPAGRPRRRQPVDGSVAQGHARQLLRSPYGPELACRVGAGLSLNAAIPRISTTSARGASVQDLDVDVAQGGPGGAAGNRPVLSLSQKSELERDIASGVPSKRHQLGDAEMPLRPMGREQMWMLPPTLDELLPLDYPG